MTDLTDKEPYLSYQKLFKEMEKEIGFYRKCIELTYSLMWEIEGRIYEDFNRDGPKPVPYMFQLEVLHLVRKRVKSTYVIAHIHELDILHRVLAHYTLLEKGIVIASYSHLRTIHELILRIYLIKNDEEDGNLICDFETLELFDEEKRKQIKKKVRESDYFKAKYVEEKIYSKEKRKKFRDLFGKRFYSSLSEMTHPSVWSRGSSLKFSQQRFRESSDWGIFLIMANFVLIFEIHKQFIKKESKEKVREMFKEYAERFHGQDPDFIPDRNNDKLNFKTFQDFLKYLEEG